MAHCPPRKLFKLGSEATAATVTDNGSHRSQFRGINDIPTEILWKILRQAAVLSSVTCPRSVKVDFDVVLPSLACVCRPWKDVISNRVWRASYFKALVAIDPTCRYKRTAEGVQIDGIVGQVQSLCVLGDELFVLRQQKDICVHGLETLDVTMKLRTYRPPELKLKRTLRPDFGLQDLDYVNLLQSCNANNSLYIHSLSDMIRLSPVDGRIIVRWPSLSTEFSHFHSSVDDRTGCVTACDVDRLLIYSEDGQLTRSIDVSQLVTQGLCSCVAVHDDLEAVTRANSSSFLLFQGIFEKTSITKFRIDGGDNIEKQETLSLASSNEIQSCMSDDSGRGALTTRWLSLDFDRNPVRLTVHGPRITEPRYITLKASDDTFNFRKCCLDRVRGRLFVTYPSYRRGATNDMLSVYNLLREDMK